MTVSRQDRTGLTQSRKEKEGEKAQEGSRFNEKINRKVPSLGKRKKDKKERKKTLTNRDLAFLLFLLRISASPLAIQQTSK